LGDMPPTQGDRGRSPCHLGLSGEDPALTRGEGGRARRRVNYKVAALTKQTTRQITLAREGEEGRAETAERKAF